MSAPVEVLLSELQCRILVEVYLAHGPVDIFRLWSEMFERQKSISSGLLSFTRAIVQLEDEGYLQKVAEMNSTLAPKGEMYLIGAVLSGELPEGCWEKLSSTQNILDVAPQGGTGVSGGVDGHAEGIASRSPRLGNTEAVTLKGGVPPTGMASVKRTPNSQSIGLNPASAAGSEYRISPADSRFQGTTIDELLALVASKLPDISLSRQHELEEIEAEREGGDTAASGYNDPAGDRSFA